MAADQEIRAGASRGGDELPAEAAPKVPAPGSKCMVMSVTPVVLRAGSGLAAEKWGELAPGSVVVLHDIMQLKDGTRRARVDKGWFTVSMKEGEETLEWHSDGSRQGMRSPATPHPVAERAAPRVLPRPSRAPGRTGRRRRSPTPGRW